MPKKIAVGTILLLLAGLSAFLGYRLYNLTEAHAVLADELEKTSHRADLLQRKYAEQKARNAAVQRDKLMIEGLKRQAELKAETLEKELEKQKAAIAAMDNKGEVKVRALEARLEEKQSIIEQWKEKYGALSNAFGEAKKIIADKNGAIDKLEANKQELESELQMTQRTRDRYFKHNREMADIAKSILARYDEDGVFAKTILSVEPFTQIKKVDLEKLIQTYLDKIDDQVIREHQN